MNDLHPDILDLLVLRATEGLNDTEAAELARLLDAHDLRDTLELDLAAAAAANAFSLRELEDSEPAPLELRQKLHADAATHFAATNVIDLQSRQPEKSARTAIAGWAVAAMLAVALMLNLMLGEQAAAPNPAELRANLLATDSSVEQISWAVSEFEDYAQVRGDVVWSDAQQEGYMLLSQLPANDPGVSQYQLWIVDPDRDANPVDGGVFDAPTGGGEFVVPIAAALSVDQPVAFAITREKPGGVVVSKGPLLVVASAG